MAELSGDARIVRGPITTRSGRVLTDADLESLADEAERGFDLSKWHRRSGRPFLSSPTLGHAPRIAVRLPADLNRRVRDKAEAEGRSVSKVVRSLLEVYAGRR